MVLLLIVFFMIFNGNILIVLKIIDLNINNVKWNEKVVLFWVKDIFLF